MTTAIKYFLKMRKEKHPVKYHVKINPLLKSQNKLIVQTRTIKLYNYNKV